MTKPVSLNQIWKTSGQVTNLHQAYNSPEFRRKLNDLQQSKYRQGIRNTTDVRGNQIYVPDEYDKITCLPQHLQLQARTELERIERLKIRAEPFDFDIQVSTTEYILHLRDKPNASHRYGVARKIMPINQVESKPSPEAYLFSVIDDMKEEVGCNTPPVDVDVRMAELKQKLLETMSVPEVDVQAPPFRMKDSRKRKPSPRPQCKDHGNVLEPRGEGVLVCPIVGCTVEMRKKNAGAAFRKPELKEPQSSEEVKAKVEAEDRATVIADIEDLKNRFGENIQPDRWKYYGLQPPTSAPNVLSNDNLPEVEHINGRLFLKQKNTTNTGWSYIDLTSSFPQYQVLVDRNSGFKECDLTIHPKPV